MNGTRTGNRQKSVEIPGPDSRSRTHPNTRTRTTFGLRISKSPGKPCNLGRGTSGGDRRETSQTRDRHLPSPRTRATDWGAVHALGPTLRPGDRSGK